MIFHICLYHVTYSLLPVSYRQWREGPGLLYLHCQGGDWGGMIQVRAKEGTDRRTVEMRLEDN